MKTGDLAKLFGVSSTTIQTWAARYDEFLSPKRGIQRQFDENDVLILATVAKLSADGFSHEKIMDRLKDGYRVDNPNVANFGVDTRMIPAAAVEQIIDSTEIRAELEAAKHRLDFLEKELEKRDQEIDQVRSEKDRLMQEIGELRERLGRAEGELNYRRQLDEKHRDE